MQYTDSPAAPGRPEAAERNAPSRALRAATAWASATATAFLVVVAGEALASRSLTSIGDLAAADVALFLATALFGGLLAGLVVASCEAILGGLRGVLLRRFGRATTPILVAALAAAAAPAWRPLFAGPVARRLPYVGAYPWALSLLIAASVYLLVRSASRRPRATAAIAAVLGLGCMLVDARVLAGHYERFHESLGACSYAASAWAGLLVGRRAAPRRASVVLLVLAATGGFAAAHVAKDGALAAELGRRTSVVWRVADFVGRTFRVAPTDGLFDADPSQPEDDSSRDLAAAARREHVAAFDPTARARRPSVLFVAVDGLRADRGPGSARAAELMPRVSRWAEEGAVFTRAYAPTVFSWPSIRSILTGIYPDTFEFSRLEPTSIFGVLKRRGYAAAFLSSFPMLDRTSGQWLASFDADLDVHEPTATLERQVEAVRAMVAGERPFVAWLHPCATHAPYDAPPAYVRAPGPAGAYDAAVRRTDDVFGPLLEELSDRDVYVAFFADHGEEFAFEHGFAGHGASLFEGAVHVPLVIRGPGVVKGRRDVVVSLVDLVSTMSGCAGIADPAFTEGCSLLPELFGGPASALRRRDAVFVERRRNHYGEAVGRPARAMISGTHKINLTRNPDRYEAYDLVADPSESRNLCLADPALAANLRDRFARRLASRAAAFNAAGLTPAHAVFAVDAETERALAGTLAGGSLAERRAAARALASASRPALAESFRRATDDPDPKVRAWAAVALGRLAGSSETWPIELALDGPSNDARSDALSLACDGARFELSPRLAEALPRLQGSQRTKAAIALIAMGHRDGLDALFEELSAQEPRPYVVRDMIARLVRRPRPGTAAALAAAMRRLGGTSDIDRHVLAAAASVPSAASLQIVDDAARSKDLALRLEAEGLRPGVRASIEAARTRLLSGDGAVDADWMRGPYHVAWGIAPGVDFVRPPKDALNEEEWSDAAEPLPVRRQLGREAGVVATPPFDATHAELAWASLQAGTLEVSCNGAGPISYVIHGGAERRRFRLPERSGPPTPLRFRWRLDGAEPTAFGWRELVFLRSPDDADQHK